MILDSIIGGIQGLASSVGSGINAFFNYKNYELQRQNYNYQKNLQQQLFSREDNAVQRRAADLKAAGLSPVLAAGSAANAGPVVSVNTPQIGAMPDMSVPVSAALAAITQKKQIEVTTAQRDLLLMQHEKTKTDIAKLVSDIKKNQYAMWKDQTSALKDQADINKIGIETATKQHDLDWYRRAGMPTNASGVQKNAGSVLGPAKEVIQKIEQGIDAGSKYKARKNAEEMKSAVSPKG